MHSGRASSMLTHGLTPDRGDHICALYRSRHELATLAAGFLADGLARGERCWYVAANDETGTVVRVLRDRGVDVDGEQNRGALDIVTGAYVADGGFNPERTVEVFSDAIEQALHDGFTGFRAAADMSWALS